jgi:hypothetical protein
MKEYTKPKNFKFCQISIYLANRSLIEISQIINDPSTDNSPISKSDTFRFYLFTLHYTFILELTKMTEKDDNSTTNHFASLEKLNKKISNIVGKSFIEVAEKNNNIIKRLRELPIIKKLLVLRDSKVAHIDSKNYLNPHSFEWFSSIEIYELFEVLDNILTIINNCLTPYSNQFILNKFSRTANLLSYNEEYKSFAHSRFKEFMLWKSSNK